MSRTKRTSGFRSFYFAERCRDCLVSYSPSHPYLFGGFLVALVVFILFIVVGPLLLIDNCYKAPGIELDDFAILDMASFHNTTATNLTQWQVSSDINLTLIFKNRIGETGCFTKLHRMKVFVYYAGNSTISVSSVPLEYTLKPKRSRRLSTEMLDSTRFLIVNDSVGSALAADLRSDKITLQLDIATRYSKANGKSDRTRTLCEVVARTPLKTNSRPGSLLGKKCVNSKQTYSL